MSIQYFAALEHEETFSHGPGDTPHKALEKARSEYELMTSVPGSSDGLIARCGLMAFHQPLIDARDVIQGLEESAYADCDDAADQWGLMETTKEQRDELEAALNLVLQWWLVANGKVPTFGAIDDSKRYQYSAASREWKEIKE